MHDVPESWSDAFARMPAQSPPVDGWRRVAAALDAPTPPLSTTRPATPPSRRPRLAGWLALAATLVLAVAVPWQQRQAATTDGAVPASEVAAAPPTIAELQAESALLETLLAHARDGRMATGSAAAMSAQLEARLAAIDSALATPGLSPAQAHALWSERVESLQALASFEGTRRWLAANGEQYDGVLVQVN